MKEMEKMEKRKISWFELALEVNGEIDADTEDEWVYLVEVPVALTIAEGTW